MNKLLRFESRKLFMRISLYILLGVALLMVLFNVLIPNMMNDLFEDVRDANDVLSIFGLSVDSTADIFIVKAVYSGEVATVLAVLIALIATSDYHNRTVKNILSRGYTRTQVYFSKLIVCEAVAVCCSVLCMLFAYVMGTVLYTPCALSFGELFPILAAQLLVMTGLCAFFVFLSTLMKNSGGALAIGIVAVEFMPLLTRVLDLIMEDNELAFRFTEYNLFSFISDLSKLPSSVQSEAVFSSMGGMGGMMENLMSTTVAMEVVNREAVIALVWLAVMILLGWLRSRKQEL